MQVYGISKQFLILCLIILFLNVSANADETISYSYDDANRLIKVQHNDGTVIDYAYDFMGNKFSELISSSDSPPNTPPETPTVIHPNNMSLNIDPLSLTVQWTGGDSDPNDAVSYFLYLGTESDPPAVRSTQELQISLSGLNSNTNYYWKIASKDQKNAITEGPIWNFTTGNTPPSIPTLVQPSDGDSSFDSNDNPEILLEWSCLGDLNPDDTVRYDLYFGTSPNPPLVASGLETMRYTVSGHGNYTFYFWKVIAIDNHGASTEGPVWKFATFSSDPIVLNGGSYTSDVTLYKDFGPLHVSWSIVVESGVQLTIEPGTILKFYDDMGIAVLGTLQAIGTPESKIIFTSLKDDSHGGDSNGDGASTTPAPGDWSGVVLRGSDDSVMDSCSVYYGAYNIEIQNSSPTISNSVTSFSSYAGISTYYSSPLITYSIISDNDANGVEIYMGTPILSYNKFLNNQDHGIFVDYSTTITNAENCWWGDSSGPYHQSSNPSGLGDAVSDSVDFTPWLTFNIFNDADSDSIPDEWETQNGLDSQINDAQDDLDDDGYSNIREYRGNTNPNDSQSMPDPIDVYIDTNSSSSLEIGDANSPFHNIQTALDFSASGDTLILQPGDYHENLLISKSIDLVAVDPARTKIIGNLQQLPTLRYENMVSGSVEGVHIQSGTTAGIEIINSNLTISKCTISDTLIGDGIAISGNSDIVIENNFICGNELSGIRINDANSTSLLTNNTLVANVVHGIHYENSSGLTIKNNIFSNNGAYGIYNESATSPSLSNNNVWSNASGNYYDISPGINDISMDPLYKDPINHDYHLLDGSPCLEAGSCQGSPTHDADGDERDVGACDIGADEYIAPIKYYALNPEMISESMEIVSLVDENIITAGSVSLNLGKYDSGSIPAGELMQGDSIVGTGPFDIASTANATDMPATNALVGTQFVVPHINTNIQKLFIMCPSGDATVQVDSNTVTALQGQVITVDTGIIKTMSSIITSDLPILVTHVAYSGTSPRFAFPVPPATTELIGIRTQNAIIGAFEDNTNVSVFENLGATKNYIISKGSRVLLKIGANGYQGGGSVLRIVADKPVMAVQYQDSDGAEATAFMPKHLLSHRFGMPIHAQYLVFGCMEPDTTITLYNTLNPGNPQTINCSANGEFPGRAYYGSLAGVSLGAGSHIESNKPIYLMYETSPGDEEHNILGVSP